MLKFKRYTTSRSLLSCRSFATLLLLGTIVSATSSADAQGVKLEKAELVAPDEDREDALRTTLRDTYIDLELQDASIAEFVDVLRAKIGVAIRIDSAGLETMGYTSNDRILTMKLKGVSLYTALRNMFKDEEGLIWVVHQETLTLTSADRVGNYLRVKNYDVSNLLDRNSATSGRVVFKQANRFDPYQLEDLIKSSIEPAKWDDAGGPGTVSGVSISRDCFLLAVTNTDDVHEAVGELLAELEAFRTERLSQQARDPNEENHADDLESRVYMLNTDTLTPAAAIVLLKRMLKEIDWDVANAEVIPVGKTLLINHRQEVHRRVTDLLLELDALKPAPMETPAPPAHLKSGFPYQSIIPVVG